jgi:hypothetical protein
MKTIEKHDVQSFRNARVGQMMTLNYATKNQYAVTITATGTFDNGTYWAELTDRRGTSIFVDDNDLGRLDLKAVKRYE